PNPIGLMALLLVVSSYFMGQEVRDRISGNFGTSMGFVALQTFGVTFMYQLINSLIGSGGNFFEGLLFKSFPTMLFTLLAALPVFYVLSHSQRSHSSLGGTSLYRGSHRAPQRLK
ncbi:MAG: rod shape-determining protein MreD, partial [Atopobium sp.]|nr:rod shape-determining protein MreD [Atopobium sp.]